MKSRLPRNVWITGWVSFFMDVSSEMVYPLVPLFLSSTLGASKSVVGVIEGIAEASASILKLFSGVLADRFGKNKLLMGIGYATSVASRPVLALATGWGIVLAPVSPTGSARESGRLPEMPSSQAPPRRSGGGWPSASIGRWIRQVPSSDRPWLS